MEPVRGDGVRWGGNSGLRDTLVDGRSLRLTRCACGIRHSGFALRDVPEPYRTTLVLRESRRAFVRRDCGSNGDYFRDCKIPVDAGTRGVAAEAYGVCRGTRGGMGLRVSKAPGKVRNCAAAETEKAQVTR